jgi:hypothetical protein
MSAAPAEGDRRHLPHRRIVSVVLWAWMLFWILGVVAYLTYIPTRGLAFSFAGIGTCLVLLLAAVWVGDLWHVRTRSRLRREAGHWPTTDELRQELWRRHDARRAKAAKSANAVGGAAGVLLETAQTGISAIGEKIHDVEKERAIHKVERHDEIDRRAATALSEAEQRYAVRHRVANIDDTQFRFRTYTTAAAYREDSISLGSAGWYQQVDEDPNFRFTLARDGFYLITWRHSATARPVVN